MKKRYLKKCVKDLLLETKIACIKFQTLKRINEKSTQTYLKKLLFEMHLTHLYGLPRECLKNSNLFNNVVLQKII